MEVDVASRSVSFGLNDAPLANIEEPLIAGGVYIYASMDGYNNLFPKITVVGAEKVEKLK
jgi:hypothetical protein